MKTLSILLAGVLFITQQAVGQSKTDQQAQALIPQGWVPVSATWGDINRDGRNDLLILLRTQGTMSMPFSIMIQIQDAGGNMSVHCNSNEAAEDQHGTGPMYNEKSLTFDKDWGRMLFKYTYYLGESEITDEFGYQWTGGDLRLVFAIQKGRNQDNTGYELTYDIHGGMVIHRRRNDMTKANEAVPLARFERRMDMPYFCNYDNAAFSRELNALANSISGQPGPAASSAPPPVAVTLGPEDGITQIPADGLYAYLDFGGDVADRSPAKRNTIQVGGEFGAFSSSKGGGALMLDGKSYVQIPGAGQKFKAPFTVSGWFNAQGKEQLQSMVTMGRTRDGTGFNFGYNLPDKNNAVYFGIIGTIPVGVQYEMKTQGWHFACATLDDKEMKLYVDGALVQTAVVPRVEWWAFKANMGVSTEPVEIGRELPTLGRYFTGMIDNVALYSRVLGEEEVKQVWNSTRPGQ